MVGLHEVGRGLDTYRSQHSLQKCLVAGFEMQCLEGWFRVQGLGFRVQGLGLRVQGSGLRV